jgi:hypothetical protein
MENVKKGHVVAPHLPKIKKKKEKKKKKKRMLIQSLQHFDLLFEIRDP